MTSYSPIPIDANRTPMQNFAPASSVVAIYADENGSVSSCISLTHDTTTVEVAAVGAPAFMRWIRTSDTEASVVSAAAGANFNHVIPAATVRSFVVPIETTVSAPNSVMGINRREGLYQRIALKTNGAASVLLTEYTVQSN